MKYLPPDIPGLFFLQNIDCGYSQSLILTKIEKKRENFQHKIIMLAAEKYYALHRHAFERKYFSELRHVIKSQGSSWCIERYELVFCTCVSENQQSAYAKSKAQISCAVTAQLISAFGFTTCMV